MHPRDIARRQSIHLICRLGRSLPNSARLGGPRSSRRPWPIPLSSPDRWASSRMACKDLATRTVFLWTRSIYDLQPRNVQTDLVNGIMLYTSRVPNPCRLRHLAGLKRHHFRWNSYMLEKHCKTPHMSPKPQGTMHWICMFSIHPPPRPLPIPLPPPDKSPLLISLKWKICPHFVIWNPVKPYVYVWYTSFNHFVWSSSTQVVPCWKFVDPQPPPLPGPGPGPPSLRAGSGLLSSSRKPAGLYKFRSETVRRDSTLF